jgi:dienelactone hydrolase
MLSGDTIAVERVAESGDTLTGNLAIAGQARFEYVARLLPDGLVATLAVTVFAPNSAPDAEPIQSALMTMMGDSVLIEARNRTRKLGTTVGALPLLNNSFGLTELFTRRARALGDSADIPAFLLTGGATLPMTLRPLTADSLVLVIAGQRHLLRVDAEGRILSAAVPTQRIEVTRVDGAEAATLTLGRPDYSAPAGAPYTATEVTLEGPGGITLGGTLTVPTDAAGPVPAVVTITGSGQQDRDEYLPVAGGYRPFRQVADTLGRRGIAVLRLDDRMVGASGGTRGTSADNADDIRAALAFLRTRPEIDGSRLALVGHSEGGLIAPMIAATDTALKGAVLMAGPSQTGAEILRFQQRQAIDNDSTFPPESRDSMYAVAHDSLQTLITTDTWLRFFADYDPLATARQVKTPILILHGSTDRQVTAEQAPALAEAFRNGGNPDVTMEVFPDLNHLFIHDPDGQPGGYNRLSSNKVVPEVLGVMVEWLVERLAVR